MHKRIAHVFLDGFTGHSAREGEPVELIVSDLATSDSPQFFLYAESIANLVFPQLKVSTDGVNRWLMVIHEDASADVYIEDIQVRVSVRVNRPFEAGAVIHRSDVSSIEDVQFPDVPIATGTASSTWTFGGGASASPSTCLGKLMPRPSALSALSCIYGSC
jgi:hypothetical protein